MGGRKRGGEEGRERKGMDPEGKGKGDRGNGRYEIGRGMGRGGRERRGGKGRRGATAPKLQFLAPPLSFSLQV